MENYFDTICAIATPLNASAIGIIRLSGEKAFEITKKIFSREIIAQKINHGWILDDGLKVDEVVVLPFKAPNSFTGEDVVEIQTHGSPVVLRKILELLYKNGAKPAQRGEFSKRAFLNHKIDITQAEAILDLIHAKTSKFASGCANNLSGALSLKITEIKKELVGLLSKIIASLDFPEDVKEVEYQEIIDITSKIIEKIEYILKFARTHNILREGIKIALAGRVNTGKSSLFNALLNIERAIVTDIEGTTRDVITETLDIKGVSATLIDTAGMRESNDTVEKIGIDNAKQYIKDADVVLFLFDCVFGIQKEDREVMDLIPKDKPLIMVASKSDTSENTFENAISVSSKTGEGIDKLKDLILEKVIGINQEESEFLTNQRQQECLREALNSLKLAKEASEREELQDLISIDIKSALLALDEITGEVMTDEILTHIFENFCIGK